MRGRKPKPTAVKAVLDDPGRRGLNAAEPRPEGDLTSAPTWFTEEQREIWDFAVSHAPAGLLKMLDMSVMVAWSVACYEFQQATQKVREHGQVLRHPRTGVPIESPYVGIMQRSAIVMMRAAEQLGFSPVARTRISLNGSQPQAQNAFLRNGIRPGAPRLRGDGGHVGAGGGG